MFSSVATDFGSWTTTPQAVVITADVFFSYRWRCVLYLLNTEHLICFVNFDLDDRALLYFPFPVTYINLMPLFELDYYFRLS